MSKKTALPRRDFLKAAAGFGGASIIGGLPFKAFADAAALAPPDRCFVFAYFQSGWDVLLSLDPRDPDVFTPDRIAETRILPGYSLLSTDSSFPTTQVIPNTRPGAAPSNIKFGPAIGNMANHYDLMSVVRGINMNTVSHEVGYRYFLTGKEPIGTAPRGSSIATEIVGQMKPRVPVPSIAYGIETYNDRYPGSANALKVSGANDLLLTLAPSVTTIDSEIEQQLINLRGQKITCEADLYNSRGLVDQYRDSQSQMSQVLQARLDQYFRFGVNNADAPALAMEKAAIRTRYGLGNDGSPSSFAARAALVGSALKRGVSQCVSITMSRSLDTHFGTQVTHAQAQREGWNALAALVDDLRETPHPTSGNFMDHTTIVIFSEFSRTPLINASGGRDHHITNSCMLLGAGVKHNFVFGKSGDVGLSAGLVEHDTGTPSPRGRQVLPEHVLASVLESAKLDSSILRVSPMKGLLSNP